MQVQLLTNPGESYFNHVDSSRHCRIRNEIGYVSATRKIIKLNKIEQAGMNQQLMDATFLVLF